MKKYRKNLHDIIVKVVFDTFSSDIRAYLFDIESVKCIYNVKIP